MILDNISNETPQKVQQEQNNLVSLSESTQPSSQNSNNNSPLNIEDNISIENLNKQTLKKRKFACVECRQQKSKCDAHERAPLPCTKCDKKGVSCILKKDFRRTYKRAKNEAIEKRFKELTKSLTNLSSDEILKKIEEEQLTLLDNRNFTKEKVHHRRSKKNISELHSPNTNINLSPLSNISYSSSENNNSIQTGFLSCKTFINGMTDTQLRCTPKSLGDIYMSSNDIADLFQEFATKYHQFLPVVNLGRGAEKIYALSPCLFWVIILIGLRRKTNSGDLMKRLTTLVKATLAEITISPIIRYTPSVTDEPVLNVASVYSVQAFLLYTFWPPLTSSLSADTSWNTIGAALFQAVRVGLNSADFSKEFATENYDLINEQKRTWICCNFISQFIASSFGFPAYVTFDHLVMSSFKNNSNSLNIPNTSKDDKISPYEQCIELKQMTQIAYFENQIVNTMNSNPSNKLGMVGHIEKLPLLRVLNQQLSELEVNLEEKLYMDNIRKFLLLVAKVHLLTYYFIDSDANNNPKKKKSLETKCGLVKVYNAAINLITHTHQMYESDPTLVNYFPGVFILNIWQSACIVTKLVNSSLSESLDVNRGKTAYQNAIVLTYKASVLKHDMAYRSSGIMRSIWSLFSNMYQEWKEDNSDDRSAEFNLDITVKSRMSVSVFFDCLYILKEKCGMAKLEREKKQLENVASGGNSVSADDDEEEEEENENDEVRKIQNPEKNARRIIETIPLDPNPINASAIKSSRDDLSSTGTSPAISSDPKDTHSTKLLHAYSSTPSITETPSGTTTLSAENLTDRNATDYSSQFINNHRNNNTQIQNSLTTETSSGLQNDGTKSGGHAIDQLQKSIVDSNIKLSYGNNNDTSRNIIDNAFGLNTEFSTDTSSNNNKESPNSIMANWDNWKSDMVWKDVDILMNGFAFNPT